MSNAADGIRREAGVLIVRSGDLMTASWFGWGTGNFISAGLLFGAPIMSALLLGAWISRGMPGQIPWNLPPAAFIALAVLAAWNTLAVALNHRNRVRVTMSALVISQGIVPWPVAFRRARIALGEIREIVVESDWDPETEVTDHRVLVRTGSGPVRVSGAVSEAKANAIAAALSDTTGIGRGTDSR